MQVSYDVEQSVDISGIFWIEDQDKKLYMRVDTSHYRVREGVPVLPDYGTGATARPTDALPYVAVMAAGLFYRGMQTPPFPCQPAWRDLPLA